MIYGWLFYPLLSVGFDQCGRCLGAGVRDAAVPLLGCDPQTKSPYRSLIERMIKHGHIPKSDEPRWMAGLQLRNDAEHPATPAIGNPGEARAGLRITAEQLNKLFARVADRGSSPTSYVPSAGMRRRRR